MKNIEKVKNMTAEEMAACFGSAEDCKFCVATDLCKEGVSCKDTILEWLQSEAK